MTMKPGKLYGVGIGPGDPQYLTLRAAEVLRQVDVIFTVESPNAAYSISRTVVASLAPLRGELQALPFTMSRNAATRAEQIRANAATMEQALRAGCHCAFATLGDAMTYSTFGYVLEHLHTALPELDVEVVPGITSFAALAAKMCRVLVENDEMLRVIPAFRPEMAAQLDFPPHSTTVLLKSYHSRAALLERLRHEPQVEVLYGERLCMDEQFCSADPAAVAARPETYLSLMMVKKHGQR